MSSTHQASTVACVSCSGNSFHSIRSEAVGGLHLRRSSMPQPCAAVGKQLETSDITNTAVMKAAEKPHTPSS